ncbi:hypothetical protein JAAARDRAFT_488821 [Jaapia argillacea MUCL 33604]|uniref:Uncharacterized protein n=1 Tax=Jaapia argillacea MUCL 33604 TaxID=933084 RepID=A0A067PM68_9AGAM|nr:hypothetical protein JAAARDRAFT_488821 [Jaapia argillacea MUCL 33604]
MNWLGQEESTLQVSLSGAKFNPRVSFPIAECIYALDVLRITLTCNFQLEYNTESEPSYITTPTPFRSQSIHHRPTRFAPQHISHPPVSVAVGSSTTDACHCPIAPQPGFPFGLDRRGFETDGGCRERY